MKLSPRLKNTLITLVLVSLIGGLAALTHRFTGQIDITSNASNTLSDTSQKILATLSDKVEITAYLKKDATIRLQIEQLIARYQDHKANINLTFVDPASIPEKTRELNIGSEGGILIEYQGRLERLVFIDEASLTNALLQLANANERWVSFLSGHGERAPDGIANFDLGSFGKALDQHKIKAQPLNLATVQAIPHNSNLLVISAPAVPLMEGELTLIKQYIDKGGNLLLLTDPNNANLNPLLDMLGVRVLAGTLVDGQSKLYGIDDPSFVLASEYTKHPITKGFKTITVYPATAALEVDATSPFKAEALLSSAKQSWTETNVIAGKIRFDAGGVEKAGPLNFAYALTRTINKDTEQRIVVVGDGDFLSNTYIGNVGNLDMGLRMVNWLIHDDKFIDIPAKTTPDSNLQLSPTAIAVLSFGFLIILPVLLLVTGFFVWRRRNRR
ncbi:MAG: ABC transporter [Methylococcaceae bacterium NSP1-2]|nr:GldG family protein [Methylococcaceae bacterium]OYV16848.1 MAG: ABC transporter [Methylococcaceae bacterium NSP1-2]